MPAAPSKRTTVPANDSTIRPATTPLSEVMDTYVVQVVTDTGDVRELWEYERKRHPAMSAPLRPRMLAATLVEGRLILIEKVAYFTQVIVVKPSNHPREAVVG